MIHYRFDIDSWKVSVWVAVDSYDTEIYEDMIRAGASGDAMRSLCSIIESGKENVGMTYTNMAKEESIVLIGKSSGMHEMINTIFHETFHLTIHIAEKRGLNLKGEDICYLNGRIGEELFLLSIGS